MSETPLITITEARAICKKAGTTLDIVASAYAKRTGGTIYDSYGIPKFVEELPLREQLARPMIENL